MMQTGDTSDVIEATIVRYDDQVDRCTLHPADAPRERVTTEWITAEEGGYVYVAEWR